MKTKNTINKIHLVRSLLFLSLLLFTFCQEGSEEIIQDNEAIIKKDSQITMLMKTAVMDDDNDDQCLEYKYPLAFYVYYPNSKSIETIVIYNDDELIDFFENLTIEDQISIDFPKVLLGVDGEEVAITNLTGLKDTLQVAVDACSGNPDYESCDNNNKKAYVCHDGNTICISVNAIQTHLDHGDVLGQCN